MIIMQPANTVSSANSNIILDLDGYPFSDDWLEDSLQLNLLTTYKAKPQVYNLTSLAVHLKCNVIITSHI